MTASRLSLLLGSAVAILTAGGVGYAVSQEDPPRDAQAAPAASSPPAASTAEQPPSSGTEEAPPATEAPTVIPNDPSAAAEEDRLTAQAEAEASRAPAAAPSSRRRAGSTSGSGAATEVASGADQTAAPVAVLPRQRLAVAVLQGLDKTTARTLRFYAPVNQPVRYEGLVVTARACETTNAGELRQDTFAYLEVFSQPRPQAGHPSTEPRRIYNGWMSAQAPSVHPFGHPAYDVWLVECRASAPARAGGA